MKVVLPELLFAPQVIASSPFLLPTLFHLCLGRHKLTPDFDTGKSSTFQSWRGSRSPNERDAVDAVLRESLQAEAREIIDSVIVADAVASDWAVSPPLVGPNEIGQMLQAPLTILVENEINDGNFLRAVGFGFDRDAFLTGLQRGHIRFEHAGGSTMKALIEQRARDRARAHRTWVIFDGDALVPNEPSSEATDKIDLCKTAAVRHHMLSRRAIENYLPHEEIDAFVPLDHSNTLDRKAVGAFRRLRSLQRAHYNLKKGFDGDKARLAAGGADVRYAPAVETHYADVSVPDRSALATGFGSKIAQLFVAEPDKGRPGISELVRRRDGQDVEMIPLFRDIVRSL